MSLYLFAQCFIAARRVKTGLLDKASAQFLCERNVWLHNHPIR